VGTDPLDIEWIRADWHGRGFSCDPWVDPPGQCWKDFVHATDELVIVLEGLKNAQSKTRRHRYLCNMHIILTIYIEIRMLSL